MPTVFDLTIEELTDRLVAWDEPAFRAKQVWSQLWKRAATYEQMSDVSPALRERLAEDLPLGVEVLTERTADRGATRKALLKLGGQHIVDCRPHGLSGPGHGLRVVPGRVRDGVHVLRHRADGPAEQPDRR